MSHKYFKPVKKYVSRKTAIERMKLTGKMFDKLSVLCSVYPVVADSKHCYDKADGWYYKIDDIKRIFYSDAYSVLNNNAEKAKKKQCYARVEQHARANRIIDDEVNFVELVKQKYSSLGSSIEDLGNTLRNLYFIEMLSIDSVGLDLRAFEEFVAEKMLLDKAFLSRKGIYYAFSCEKIIVCWLVPYPGYGLKDLVEEKQELPEAKPDFDFDFLDFGSFSEEECESSGEVTDPNDPSKMDIALLKYASPLLQTHLKLVLYKLSVLYANSLPKGPSIFGGQTFFVDVKSIQKQIEFVIKSGGGEIVSPKDAKIIVAESVDDIKDAVVYIQPQYVFDSLNQRRMIAFDDYLVGKDPLPVHTSPFPSVMDTIDSRALKTLSNRKKYDILDRIESLD